MLGESDSEREEYITHFRWWITEARCDALDGQAPRDIWARGRGRSKLFTKPRLPNTVRARFTCWYDFLLDSRKLPQKCRLRCSGARTSFLFADRILPKAKHLRLQSVSIQCGQKLQLWRKLLWNVFRYLSYCSSQTDLREISEVFILNQYLLLWKLQWHAVFVSPNKAVQTRALGHQYYYYSHNKRIHPDQHNRIKMYPPHPCHPVTHNELSSGCASPQGSDSCEIEL